MYIKTQLRFNKKTISKQTATMYVPEKPKELSKYMGLYNRETGEKYELSDDGAIINEKLAKHFRCKSWRRDSYEGF